jgi:hypothetical protein
MVIRPGEIREGNGQLQFSLTVLETAQLQPQLKLGSANPSPALVGEGIDLSGAQVLVGSLSALCTLGLLLWAIIRLWLFEP